MMDGEGMGEREGTQLGITLLEIRITVLDVSVEPHAPVALPTRKSPQNQLNSRQGGPQSRS
jgi:hypothetical protein